MALDSLGTASHSDTICHAISIFVNPAANDLVIEAAIKDTLDKLERGAELLQTGAIAMTVLPIYGRSGEYGFEVGQRASRDL